MHNGKVHFFLFLLLIVVIAYYILLSVVYHHVRPTLGLSTEKISICISCLKY